MINRNLKNQIDKIYNLFYTLGITNPLEILEHITYFIFIKMIDNINFDTLYKYSICDEYISEFKLKIKTHEGLKKVVTEIDNIISESNNDLMGDIYEYMISKLGTSKINGQFRTPIHIIDLIVELMKPTKEDKIIDPAVGSGGFLIESIKYMKRKNLSIDINSLNIYGFDIDIVMTKIASMNMIINGIYNPKIEHKNSLYYINEENKYDLILANPPFKGSVDKNLINKDLVKIVNTDKNELLFLALLTKILNENGRCAVILTDGVLFGKSKAHIDIKKELIKNNTIEAIISMPSGVFKPYSGVSTSIIIFRKMKKNKDYKIWFYHMENDGYSLDNKRKIINENDIPDIIYRFNNRDKELFRKRTDKSFYVNVSEIIENEYDLSINKYKKAEVKEIVFESSEIIIENILNLESEVMQSIEELREITKELSNEL